MKGKITIFVVILKFLRRIFKLDPSAREKIQQKTLKNFHQGQSFVDKIQKKFVNFISILMMVQRSIKTFRFRTKFRNFYRMADQDFNLINDVTYFKEIEENDNSKFNFIYNKTLRKTMRAIKHYTRKFMKGVCFKILSTIYNFEN